MAIIFGKKSAKIRTLYFLAIEKKICLTPLEKSKNFKNSKIFNILVAMTG